MYEISKSSAQVYARFILLDSVTGYRSQYHEASFIMKAR